jgi:hypothetical protein
MGNLMIVADMIRRARAWIQRFLEGTFFLLGLIILGWILAQIFFGLRLSVMLVICAVAAVVVWTLLSHFLPFIRKKGMGDMFRKKD